MENYPYIIPLPLLIWSTETNLFCSNNNLILKYVWQTSQRTSYFFLQNYLLAHPASDHGVLHLSATGGQTLSKPKSYSYCSLSELPCNHSYMSA